MDARPIHVAAIWNLQSVVRLLLKERAIDATDVTICEALWLSCKFGHYEIAKMILEYTKLDEYARSEALKDAAEHGYDEVVTLILENSLSKDENDILCKLAIYQAASSGHLSVIKTRHRAGAALDGNSDANGTALQIAAKNQHIEIVIFSLDHHVYVNRCGGSVGTALHTAVRSSKKEHSNEIIQLLLQAGANPNIVGCNIGSAMQAAASEVNIDLVKTFLKHGGDIHASKGEYGSLLHAAASTRRYWKEAALHQLVEFLLGQGCDVNILSGKFGTALQAASSEGHISVVHLLLKHGANVNLEGGYYKIALQAAAQCPWCSTDFFPKYLSVSMLLNAGAVEVKGGFYGNLLQAACHANNLDLVKDILKSGANVNEEGGHLSTALYAAIIAAGKDEETELVDILLTAGADLNTTRDSHPYGSPLMAAVTSGNRDLVMTLINHGAEVKPPPPPFEGSSFVYGPFDIPLHAAAVKGDIKMMTLLLDLGATLNHPEYEVAASQTALYLAIYWKQKRAAIFLLERGAILDIWRAIQAAQSEMHMIGFILDNETRFQGSIDPRVGKPLALRSKWTCLSNITDALVKLGSPTQQLQLRRFQAESSYAIYAHSYFLVPQAVKLRCRPHSPPLDNEASRNRIADTSGGLLATPETVYISLGAAQIFREPH